MLRMKAFLLREVRGKLTGTTMTEQKVKCRATRVLGRAR